MQLQGFRGTAEGGSGRSGAGDSPSCGPWPTPMAQVTTLTLPPTLHPPAMRSAFGSARALSSSLPLPQERPATGYGPPTVVPPFLAAPAPSPRWTQRQCSRRLTDCSASLPPTAGKRWNKRPCQTVSLRGLHETRWSVRNPRPCQDSAVSAARGWGGLAWRAPDSSANGGRVEEPPLRTNRSNCGVRSSAIDRSASSRAATGMASGNHGDLRELRSGHLRAPAGAPTGARSRSLSCLYVSAYRGGVRPCGDSHVAFFVAGIQPTPQDFSGFYLLHERLDSVARQRFHGTQACPSPRPLSRVAGIRPGLEVGGPEPAWVIVARIGLSGLASRSPLVQSSDVRFQ